MAKHWYIPRSSLVVEVILTWSAAKSRTLAPVRSGWPSLSHVIVLWGVPVTLQLKKAAFPRSIVWLGGVMCTFSAVLIINWTSIVSLPSELVAVQKYEPLSVSFRDIIVKVPSRIVARPVLRSSSSDSSRPFFFMCHLFWKLIMIINCTIHFVFPS